MESQKSARKSGASRILGRCRRCGGSFARGSEWISDPAFPRGERGITSRAAHGTSSTRYRANGQSRGSRQPNAGTRQSGRPWARHTYGRAVVSENQVRARRLLAPLQHRCSGGHRGQHHRPHVAGRRRLRFLRYAGTVPGDQHADFGLWPGVQPRAVARSCRCCRPSAGAAFALINDRSANWSASRRASQRRPRDQFRVDVLERLDRHQGAALGAERRARRDRAAQYLRFSLSA